MGNDRMNFPLEVGDEVEIDGQRAVFEDYPTDGPQFHLPDEEPPFDTVQLESDEAKDLLGDY